MRVKGTRESMIKGEEWGVQQQQMKGTTQVSEKTDDLTIMTSEDQDIMFSATFMVKVCVCQTFQQGECSTKRKDTLQEQMCMTSHVKKTLDNVTSVNVSTLQIEPNGNEALMERQPTEYRRKTVSMYKEKIVSIFNSADGYRAKADDFDRKGVIVWIFSFMTMTMMIMASCKGQWTCKLGKIFRKGAESCSKRIRGWLRACCFIECYRIGKVLLYMKDIYKRNVMWIVLENIIKFN